MEVNVDTYTPGEESAPITELTITVTDAAAAQVTELMNEMNDDDVVGLRIFVQGGGCSGFQYGFTFEDEIGDDDAVIEQNGVKFLVDELSYQYLIGSVIDYTKEVFGSRFEISNPNVSSTCGCGSSFGV
jgi:iron-sulfur cluster insertion protein